MLRMRYAVVLLLSICSAQASMDLTPIVGERVLAGVKFKQLVFNDEGHKITYEPPLGWSYNGGGTKLRLMPSEIGQAQADIEQVLADTSEALNEAAMKSLQLDALQRVPPGAAKAVIIAEEKNPMLIDGKETYSVIVEYQFAGVPFKMSLLYLNVKNAQLRFRAIARENDFEKVHRAFRASILTWHWAKPART